MNRKSIRKIIVGVLLSLTISFAYEIHDAIPVFAADTVVVNGTNVNVRSQPNTKSKSLGKVSKGTTLQRVEERTDGWSSIEYNGTTAYIRSDLLISASAASTVGKANPSEQQPSSNVKKTSSSYIANTNSHKFHKPSCSSVSDMKEKNKWYFEGSRDELINQGYSPCKRCKP